MKKYFKFDKSKLILKIVLIALFLCFYGYLFYRKLYLFEDHVSVFRLVVPLLFIAIFSFGLFFKPKYKLSDKNKFIVIFIISFLFIVFNLFIIQYGQGYNFLNIKWKLIIMNLITIGILYMIFFSISNSAKVSIIGINALTLLFTLAEYYVYKLRGVGFAAGDISNLNAAMNVAGSYSYELNYEVFISIIVLITLSFLALYLPKNPYFKGLKRLIPIVTTIILILIFIFSLYVDRIDKRLRVKYFNTQYTYRDKGAPISFVKSIKDLIILNPKGYSIDYIKKIADKNKSDKKDNKEEPNIIIIMDEAYTDFSSIVDLKLSEDPLPFIHDLEDNTIKGELYTSIFGGGTSNTEFEVLTSNTMAFLPTNVNPYRIYIKEKFPSLTYTLEDQGYGGLIAMHPYRPNGYSRSAVYPLLGFKQFISVNDFPRETERLGRFVSDKANFDRIIKEYEDFKKENDKPYFLFNITMQNHTPFSIVGAPHKIKLEYDTDYPEATQYFNRLKYTDEAVKGLIEYFEKKDDKTIIVFFGDHQPRIEGEFYEEVMKTYKKEKQYKPFEKYNTEFFIWANYDIEEKDDVRISANYLGSYVLDVAGLNKTGYDKYVLNLREKIPVLSTQGYIGDNNKYYSLDNKKSPYYNLVQDYKIVQHNDLLDAKKRVNKLFYLSK